jgi:HlyD family secretion protein
MIKTKTTVITAIASCIFLAAIVAFFYFKKPKVSTPTVAVTKGSITEKAEAVGNIKTRSFSTVKSQVNGIVEAIYHEEGEYVKKDTPLIKIKPAPAPVEYAQAHKDLINDISEENDTKTALERQEHLLSKKIITKNNQEYTTALKKYNEAKTQRVLSEQKLALLTKGETTVDGKTVANTVTAPIDGYILYRNVSIGDPVISISSAQAATPLFIIANMQELIFQGLVDESDVAKIKVGMPADIKVGSLPDRKIAGTISRIALQSDRENAASGIENSGSQSKESNSSSPFNVGFRVEITNLKLPKDLLLRSGYSATADITVNKVDETVCFIRTNKKRWQTK